MFFQYWSYCRLCFYKPGMMLKLCLLILNCLLWQGCGSAPVGFRHWNRTRGEGLFSERSSWLMEVHICTCREERTTTVWASKQEVMSSLNRFGSVWVRERERSKTRDEWAECVCVCVASLPVLVLQLFEAVRLWLAEHDEEHTESKNTMWKKNFWCCDMIH